jgi:DNA-binding beta-propeller fold protein YncE
MILRFDGMTGAFVDRFVWDDPMTPKDETGGLSGPGAVLFGPDGDLFVSSFDSDAILKYDGASGAFVEVFVTAGSGGLDGPDAGMVFGPDGHLYVPGYYSDTIPRYDGVTGDPLGNFTPAQGNMLDRPRTLVFHGEHLYVANEGSDEVLRYDANTGAFVDVFVAAGVGGLSGPAGMVFDPDGVLHVAVDSNKVLRFDPDGAPLPGIGGRCHGRCGPGNVASVCWIRCQ